ncbi:phage prohead protease, HK97 family [Bradyrhizobium lablabi]|uniref:Phage prohead protease, HK97 family n=1 Tax=Bradyrhizobium lablabi TaxID=722472 RepID=A0A1M6LHF3_9BRAD|nr:HK97 family phage prohead protease [Bradyrhizobium lablabi]SHJ70619.1 phage prohead protease, HK97 family [Bradyrhizobium lablabi]
MKKTVVDIAEFRSKLVSGSAPGVLLRLAPSADLQMVGDERVMKFVFSDGSVDRYGDTIDARGWVLDSFNANPVALFGHDANTIENVIGKARNVRVEGTRLVGEIEFMEASVNPKAEAVYQMLKGGYLNAVSVGFQPIEWDLSKDKSRPQGINFKKQELLEISVVPVPALPTALVQARAAGIDVDRLGLVDEVIEPPADKVKRRSALLVRKVLGRKTKGLYDLGFLISILSDLGMLTSWSEWEAEIEGDGSNVPNMLVDILFDLADAFTAMANEELAEFLADFNDEPDTTGFDDVELAYVAEGKSAPARCFRAARMRAKYLATGKIEKAGRVLSAENQKKLRDAHTQLSAACDIVKGVADSADVTETDADDSGKPDVIVLDDQKAARERRERIARARKAQAEAV